MKHIFSPNFRDTQYGDLHQNRALMSHLGCSRLFLHSNSLSFIHPITKEQITITAGLDEQWQQLMNQFDGKMFDINLTHEQQKKAVEQIQELWQKELVVEKRFK